MQCSLHSQGMLTASDIRQARGRLGESQTEFGTRFGVDQSTIHRWETDGLPDRGVTRMAVERMLGEIAPPVPAEAAE